jgi:hypothetical protein
LRSAAQAVTLLAFALLVAACGTTSTAGSIAGGGALRVLSATAVPGVPATTRSLTADELAKDASIPGIASKLSAWGFVDGAERTFQGESRHLTFVDSRALVFQDAGGAEAYVAFVHDNVSAYFGVATVQPLTAQGRPGWQIAPSACACHLANPVVVGVVFNGTNVSWLEINGPDATPALLMSLLDPSNSVPAS